MYLKKSLFLRHLNTNFHFYDCSYFSFSLLFHILLKLQSILESIPGNLSVNHNTQTYFFFTRNRRLMYRGFFNKFLNNIFNIFVFVNICYKQIKKQPIFQGCVVCIILIQKYLLSKILCIILPLILLIQCPYF